MIHSSFWKSITSKEVSGLEDELSWVSVASYQGSSSGKWMEFHRNIGSDESPFVYSIPSVLFSISMSANVFSHPGDTHFEIYKNGSLIYTYIQPYPQTTYFIDGLTFGFSAGDTLSAYGIPRVSPKGDLTNPVMFIYSRKDI